MKAKALLIVNPISGGVDKADMRETIRTYAETNNIAIETYETTGEDDEKKIRKLYKKGNFERVIAVGGDGTVKMVAEAFEGDDVKIGLIPAGSANGLSVDLDFPSEIDQQIDAAFGSNFMELDMICINDKKSLHLSDIGLNARMIKNYEDGTIRGKLGYAIQAFNTLTVSEDPFHTIINANGKTYETDAKMIVIANSQKYGTGVTVNPSGKMDDGLFEIVIMKNLDISVISKFIMGNIPLETGEVEIISTDKATIKTQVPVHFQVDGEYCGEETCLDIRILKHELKLAVPRL